MHIGILGGGISGLTLHRFLKHPSEVLEKAAVPGGLCRTFWKDGFGFDIGGHILFSKHKHVTELIDRLLGDNINRCRRANKILFKGRYVKYPFENDLGALDKQDAYECLIDYLKADFPAPTNLEEWAYATFGRAISDKYFLPYNRKIWKMEPRNMGLEWVSRIPKPPLEDVVKSAMGIETEGYTHQLFFRYPLHGGFEAVVKAMVPPNASITCNAAIRSIRKEGDGWRASDGERDWRFDHLVLAFPVMDAIRCFENVPAEVRQTVERLRYNALAVWLYRGQQRIVDGQERHLHPGPDGAAASRLLHGFFQPEHGSAGHFVAGCRDHDSARRRDRSAERCRVPGPVDRGPGPGRHYSQVGCDPGRDAAD